MEADGPFERPSGSVRSYDTSLLEFYEQPWSVWIKALGRNSPLGDDEDLYDKRYRRNVQRLDKKDMGLYGQFPGQEDFVGVVCEDCNAVVKPQGLHQHVKSRHASSNSVPLLLPPPVPVKGKSKGSFHVKTKSKKPSGSTPQKDFKTKDVESIRERSISPPQPVLQPVVTLRPIQVTVSCQSTPVVEDCTITGSNTILTDVAAPLVTSVSSSRKRARSKSERKCLPIKDREYNPDQHCGVLLGENTKPCLRSLTCKTHSLSLRRTVAGRSKPFNQLLADHRLANNIAKEAARGTPVAAPVIISSASKNIQDMEKKKPAATLGTQVPSVPVSIPIPGKLMKNGFPAAKPLGQGIPTTTLGNYSKTCSTVFSRFPVQNPVISPQPPVSVHSKVSSKVFRINARPCSPSVGQNPAAAIPVAVNPAPVRSLLNQEIGPVKDVPVISIASPPTMTQGVQEQLPVFLPKDEPRQPELILHPGGLKRCANLMKSTQMFKTISEINGRSSVFTPKLNITSAPSKPGSLKRFVHITTERKMINIRDSFKPGLQSLPPHRPPLNNYCNITNSMGQTRLAAPMFISGGFRNQNCYRTVRMIPYMPNMPNSPAMTPMRTPFIQGGKPTNFQPLMPQAAPIRCEFQSPAMMNGQETGQPNHLQIAALLGNSVKKMNPVLIAKAQSMGEDFKRIKIRPSGPTLVEFACNASTHEHSSQEPLLDVATK